MGDKAYWTHHSSERSEAPQWQGLNTPVYVGRGIIRLYPDDSSTPVVLGRGDIRLEPDERSTPSDFGHGDTRLPPYEGTQWQGMNTPSDLGRGISRLHLDEHNEQPQWQGLNTPPGLGRGISRLHPYERNEQPQWQGLNTPPELGRGITHLHPNECNRQSQWQGLNTPSEHGRGLPQDVRNEQPQWQGNTPSELGRGDTRLPPDARNEQPQWQRWSASSGCGCGTTRPPQTHVTKSLNGWDGNARNEQPQWQGWNTPLELGCDASGLHPERNEQPQWQGLNTPAQLGRGNIKTDKNNLKEFTILLVGETGTGKTTLLSLLANILLGHRPEEFVNFNDRKLEAGGGAKYSQTNDAKVYPFTSRNGIKLTILDTPGLADTRGLQQDKQHKASIAKAIKENIATVNAVIILANGTQPRLGTATDYVLSTLSAIFPRTLADNIGILFTNVSSTLDFNFDPNSLPEVLRTRDDNRWFVNNPLAMRNKYKEKERQQTASTRRLQSSLLDAIRTAYQTTLGELCSMFDWLDDRDPQPTKDIWQLYEQSQQIEKDIESAMSYALQMSQKKKQVEDIRRASEGNESIMKLYKDFKHVNTSKIWVREKTNRHNTLCSAPNCYGNCHVECNLQFSTDPEKFLNCAAILGGEVCRVCEHKYDTHRHYNELWKQEDHTQLQIDHEAERKFNAAKQDNVQKEAMLANMDQAIRGYESNMQAALASVRNLTESYSKLALSGTFTGQFKSAIKMLKEQLEAFINNNADRRTVEMVQESLKIMQDRLDIMQKAKAS